MYKLMHAGRCFEHISEASIPGAVLRMHFNAESEACAFKRALLESTTVVVVPNVITRILMFDICYLG
jgi:hypothetical protein